METVYTFNMQGFSLHDGAGIRTSVFFKGCPLACAWCHNPEGQSFRPQWSLNRERCTGCGACEAGQAPQNCVSGARTLIGEPADAQALLQHILRERAFFEQSGGGVTLTGGECLSQPEEFLLPLLKGLKRRGISVNIDTCGEVPWDKIEHVLPYADTFLYDLKLMDDDMHLRYTGVGNRRILNNLVRLAGTGAKVWLRIPLIHGINDTPDEQSAMLDFAAAHLPGCRVALLPYHDIGRAKFARLNLPDPPRFAPPDEESLHAILRAWKNRGFDVTIGG